jgi:glycosyltransferase involved in cell wall biosynthesis
MYSGNIGLAHTFEAILDAAAILQTVEPKLLFLFVGDGPRLPWLREESARRRLTNLRFIAPHPRERLAESLSAAEVHLVTMRDDLCGLVVPSKFYGVAAAGRPTVFVGPANSEVARDIVREQCGSVLPGTTGAELAKCLLAWRADAAARSAAGARARAHAERTGLRQAADSFEAVFDQLLP